jgi:murein DD-endopeptidase MepM/ murein hydrolase activator NlpD
MPIGRPSLPARLIAVGLATTALLPWGPSPGTAGPVRPERWGTPARLAAAKPIVAPPAFYRPVITGGMVFPVARSTYLAYLEFPDSWHDPRLRFVDGRWLLIGVHEGIDIMSEQGTPVLSMTDGVVEAVGWLFYSGTRVGIRGDDGRYYFYAHLSKVDPAITLGVRVSAGTMLGLVGNTGYGDLGHRDEFPAHLHFGIQAATGWVDPYPTLVDLYAAAVKADGRSQAELDGLAAAGRRRAWDRLAAEVYMDQPPPGE